MESYRGLTNTVILLDNYGEDSRMLHQSFRSSGFTGPVIVIEDDGFFPEDVISVYQYFSGDFLKSSRTPGRARYLTILISRIIGRLTPAIPEERCTTSTGSGGVSFTHSQSIKGWCGW